ncbi:type II toxin-antitoxin system VapC family toxin [Scytonema sp. NUACC26]|uniref:type II toxin-antitoxin system VapC family toxin n=1 Tax=Scytonema sp. NUACC26 TaxID=3140176 RepID=UPI0034DBF8A7
MSKFVVDANVAIKWVLPEIHTTAALRLLENESNVLLVPDFFFSEIGNILWKKVRRGEMTLDVAQQHLTNVIEVDFQVYPSQLLIPVALEIAVRVQQAAYDCVYLALAVAEDCQMVTADEWFVNALQKDILAGNVCWVENL